MAAEGPPLIVIGHKNPDTDSICSAIAYSRLKTSHMQQPAVPYRTGNLNDQTAFVLARFSVPSPDLATNLSQRISDIMIDGQVLTVLSPDDTLGTALRIITKHRWSFIPVAAEGRANPDQDHRDHRRPDTGGAGGTAAGGPHLVGSRATGSTARRAGIRAG